MKLIRVGQPGQERPGLQLEDGTRIEVSSFTEDYDETFFADDGIRRLADWLKSNRDRAARFQRNERLGPPIGRPSKVVCVGLNYRDHAQESGAEIPKEPVLFFKATSAIAGPFDGLVLPRGSRCADWEVELAVVIGKRASYVTDDRALDYVAGYLLHNDYSERDFQLRRGGQWVKGKSCDTFAPLGPFLATRDDIPNPQRLRLWLKVNGEFRQQGNTANMIFSVAELVSYISQFMSLLPGDVISTGTPGGVGQGMKPAQFLNVGDVVELGIEGLGESRQEVLASH